MVCCVLCSTVYPSFKVQTTSKSLMLCDFATFLLWGHLILFIQKCAFNFSCCIQFCFSVSLAVTQATALANTVGTQAFVYLLPKSFKLVRKSFFVVDRDLQTSEMGHFSCSCFSSKNVIIIKTLPLSTETAGVSRKIRSVTSYLAVLSVFCLIFPGKAAAFRGAHSVFTLSCQAGLNTHSYRFRQIKCMGQRI